jgi:ABC-2 type transport system ATP-binding protein
MIEVEHLTKYYGAFPALRDVTFNVEPGEILGFLGPNGAGKTTTMRIITGYLPATTGTVRVAGFDVAEKSLEARQHLGYLPESVPLYPELTTLEYLDFRGRITGLQNTRERRVRINEVMDRLNIADVSNKLIGALSRGYRQRVGLAQAMLHNPDVLILDEPTVGLDPVQITEVRELIKELGRDHTIILSTHLLPEVSMVCNRVIIINRGRLVTLDTPIHLTEGGIGGESVQLEVGGRPSDVLRALRGVAGVLQVRVVEQHANRQVAYGATSENDVPLPVSEEKLPVGANLYEVEAQAGRDLRAQLASAVVSGGYKLLELKSVRPSLEDIFIKVISQEVEEDEEFYEEDELAEEEFEAETELEEPIEEELEEEAEALTAPVQTKVHTKKRVRR